MNTEKGADWREIVTVSYRQLRVLALATAPHYITKAFLSGPFCSRHRQYNAETERRNITVCVLLML